MLTDVKLRRYIQTAVFNPATYPGCGIGDVITTSVLSSSGSANAKPTVGYGRGIQTAILHSAAYSGFGVSDTVSSSVLSTSSPANNQSVTGDVRGVRPPVHHLASADAGGRRYRFRDDRYRSAGGGEHFPDCLAT